MECQLSVHTRMALCPHETTIQRIFLEASVNNQGFFSLQLRKHLETRPPHWSHLSSISSSVWHAKIRGGFQKNSKTRKQGKFGSRRGIILHYNQFCWICITQSISHLQRCLTDPLSRAESLILRGNSLWQIETTGTDHPDRSSVNSMHYQTGYFCVFSGQWWGKSSCECVFSTLEIHTIWMQLKHPR